MRKHVLQWLYEGLAKKEAPYYLRLNSFPMLVWRKVRKLLNVSIIPFIPFNLCRILLYRLVGYKIGRKCFIGMMSHLDDWRPEHIVLDDSVIVSYRVTFVAHGKGRRFPITLKRGCYIGAGSVILGGVTIGENSIVGAGSVVTRDVPPNRTVCGNPATEIRS